MIIIRQDAINPLVNQILMSQPYVFKSIVIIVSMIVFIDYDYIKYPCNYVSQLTIMFHILACTAWTPFFVIHIKVTKAG